MTGFYHSFSDGGFAARVRVSRIDEGDSVDLWASDIREILPEAGATQASKWFRDILDDVRRGGKPTALSVSAPECASELCFIPGGVPYQIKLSSANNKT